MLRLIRQNPATVASTTTWIANAWLSRLIISSNFETCGLSADDERTPRRASDPITPIKTIPIKSRSPVNDWIIANLIRVRLWSLEINVRTDLSLNKLERSLGVVDILNCYPLVVLSLINNQVNPNGHSEIE